MDKHEEDELRRLIRRELENRERLRDAGGSRRASRVPEMTEERQRIIEEEVRAFHRERGRKPYVNEDGDTEWLTPDEIAERESQFPVDMEEPEIGQRRVRNRILLMTLLAMVALLLLVFALRERTGAVQVLSNVQGATILLNGSPTDYVTNARLDRLPVGPHLISLSKFGYEPQGPAAVRVEIRSGGEEIVRLDLKPVMRDSVGGS